MIDHLPYSDEGKARCGLNRWVGIDTQKDVMHCPTCNVNFCVLCSPLFQSDVDSLDIEYSIYIIFKMLKAIKITNLFTFVWYTFLRNAYTTIFVTMGSILQ